VLGQNQAVDGKITDYRALSVRCPLSFEWMGTMPAAHLKQRLAAKAEALMDLPKLARKMGVPEEVITRAMGRCADFSRSVKSLGATHAPD
jgi:hypothetical protein